MNLENLLQEISCFIGIDGIALDEEGFCMLQLQEQFLFILRFDQGQQRLVIAAEIETPVELSQKIVTSALAFNFQRMAAPGPWISLDSNTGALFLADAFSIGNIEAEIFQNRLKQFFQHYLACQGLFNEETAAVLLKEEPREVSLEPDQFA